MESHFNISPAKLPVTLKTPLDWTKWLFYVKSAATVDKVWQYVNDKVPTKELETLTEPTKPVRLTLEQLRAQDDAAIRQMKYKDEDYRDNKKVYDQKSKALDNLFVKMQASIDTRYYATLDGATTPRQIIDKISPYFAPSTLGEEMQVRREYRAVLDQKISLSGMDNWISQWTEVYAKAQAVKLPEVSTTDRALTDFLNALEPLAPAFIAYIQGGLIQGTHNFTVLQTVEQVREAARRATPSTARKANHSAFAGQESHTEDQKDSRKERQQNRNERRPKCLDGERHYWNECPYLTTDAKPEGFKLDPATIKAIQSKLKEDKELLDKIKASLARRNATPNPEVFDKGKSLGIFTTAAYSAVQDYKLKNHWILDSGADIHVTNSMEGFIKTSDTSKEDQLIAGATVYDIESYGTTEVPVLTSSGGGFITLLNVAYIPSFMTNVVALSIMTKKGVHWDTEKSHLHRNGKEFCKIHEQGGHWTLTAQPLIRQKTAMVTATAKSMEPKRRTHTAREWHELLGHPSHEALGHLVDATKGITMSDSLRIGVCEPCKLSKATQLVSRRTGNEDPTRGPFDRVSWDLIHLDESFDGDRYVSHFKCCYTGMNHVYTQARKGTTLHTFKYHLISLITQHNKRVRIIKIDGESTLALEFEHYIAGMGIKVEKSAANTQAQNGHAERGGRSIITMARTMRTHANLPSNLWSELVKTAGFLLNRIPNRRNNWKTPLEAATGIIPSLAYLHIIGCKAYTLIHGIPRLKKMEPRAQIGYLVGYNSTNQWRIWDPRKNQVRVLRDVTFDDTKLYDPQQLPLPELLEGIPEEPVRSIYEDMYLIQEEPEYKSGYIMPHSTPPSLSLSPTSKPAREETLGAAAAPTRESPMLPTPVATPEPDGGQESAIHEALQEDPTDEEMRQDEDQERASPNDHSDEIQEGEIMQPSPNIIATDGNNEIPPLSTIENSPNVINEALQITGDHLHDEETPQMQNESLETVGGRRRDLDNSGVTSEFIVPEGSKRSRRPRKQAYSAAVQRSMDSIDGFSDLFYSAFTAYRDAAPPIRLHRDDLPPEPSHWHDMKRHRFCDEFTTAAELEWSTLINKGTFMDVPIANHYKEALPLTWVFKYKFDEGGFLIKFKARVCVRGDLQMTEKETYAATLAAASFRLLMIIVAAFDLEMIQLDAVNAFLNSKIDDEEIYIRYPNGYEKANRILRLLRGLYGLKRSPLLWFNELTSTLKGLGFKEINSMHCVMANHVAIILFYVDDIIFLFQEAMRLQVMTIIASLQEKYPLHSLPRANWFLGVRIIRNRPGRQLWLCQDSYIEKITNRYYKPTNNRIIGTPLPTEKIEANEYESTAANVHLYQQEVGSINFATTMTRIDTAFATTTLSRYLTNPSDTHLALANRVLGYLEATKSYAQEYNTSSPLDLRVLSDASFADDIGRKSSQGFIIMLGGNPFMWKASKQSTVTTSTTEAELLALTDAGKEAMLWKRGINDILQYLPTGKDYPVISTDIQSYCDNTQTIRLLTKPIAEMQTKLRHVDIQHHWARQSVQNGLMKVSWMSTNDMIADLLTKPLTNDKTAEFRRKLGLVSIDIGEDA
jgi:hypothetical protein